MSAGSDDFAGKGQGRGEQQPAVSIIVPAYNAADTIVETMESALGQTFADFELLVIDDGSMDNTGEIVSSIRDPRVRLLKSVNNGPAASRNLGIRAASAELIAFLDADDLWLPNKLERQVQALNRDSEAILAYCWTDCIDEQGRFLQHGSHVRAEGKVYNLLVSRNFIDNGSNPLVRRRAFDAVGLFDEAFRSAEDWDMWQRLAWQFPFVCVPEVEVLYRVRASSNSSSVERQVEQSLAILQRGLQRLPASPARNKIKKTAESNLYKYIAVRLVETSRDRATGFVAMRYLWKFLRTTPRLFHHSGKAVLIAMAALTIIVLPPSWVQQLRNRVSQLRVVLK